MRHVYRMTGDGPDLVIAHDTDEAWELWCQAVGESRADYEQECTWEMVQPTEALTIGWEDIDEMRGELGRAADHGADPSIAKLSARACGSDFIIDGWTAYFIDAPAAWWAKMPAGVLLIGEW